MPSDKALVYSEQILPLVDALTEVCKANDIPMFAMFQDGPESFRTTGIKFDRAMGEKFMLLRMVHLAWDTDDLIRLLIEEARKHGHNSLYLKAIGVPDYTLAQAERAYSHK